MNLRTKRKEVKREIVYKVIKKKREINKRKKEEKKEIKL